MRRIRQARWAACFGAIATALAVPSTAAAASLTVTAPGSINRNTSYRVMASGTVGKPAYVILVYQHRGCSKTYPKNQAANANSASGGSLIFKKVNGTFDAQTVKLKGGVKGSVDYCAYLYGAKQSFDSKPMARVHRKVNFT